VTVDEARAVLGVDADASPVDVRHAYTTAIKRHKPDKDPEGFRRVREAFERLQAPLNTAFVASVGSHDGADAASELPPLPDPLAEIRDALVERVRGQDPSAVIAELERHVEQHPSDDAVRVWLVRLLFDARRADDGISRLAEGARCGVDRLRFGVGLAMWSPSSVDDALLDGLREDAPSSPAAVVVLVARGRVDDARALVVATLRDDVHAARDRRATWLDVVASLFERGPAPFARDVYAMVGEVVPSRADRAGLRQLELLVRELVEASSVVDPVLTRALGAFVGAPLRGAIALSSDEVAPHRHPVTSAKLYAIAPTLARITDEAVPRVLPNTTTRGTTLLTAVVVLVILFIVANLGRIVEPEHYPLHPSEATHALCDVSASRACNASREVDYYLEERRCGEAATSLTRMFEIADGHYEERYAVMQRERVIEACRDPRIETSR
jgi:curved DNA-binding protein CbpA